MAKKGARKHRPRVRVGGTKRGSKRVRVRSMYEHVQGGSVRMFDVSELPDGCSHLVTSAQSTFPYPCTRRMSHFQVKVERRWVPEEREYEHVLKLIGYCKTHRPRIIGGVLIELDHDLDKAVNGSRSKKARIKRAVDVMYLEVKAAATSNRTHLTDRDNGPNQYNNSRPDVPTLCGRMLKTGHFPVRARSNCDKCNEVKGNVVAGDV